ncbi:MAG: SufB/SufD family protein, partial [Haloechinothrix sp.]
MTVAENNVATAVETVPAGGRGTTTVVPAASRAERFSGYDVEAFEVPGGREENWRFTPMKRLRGLHNGSAVADGKVTLDIDAAPEVTVETVERSAGIASGAGGHGSLGEAGAPSDRIAAQAFTSFTKATVVTVPKETRASKATVVRVTGPGVGKTAYGHLQIRIEHFGEAAVVLDHVGSGTYADNVEFVVGDGAKLTVVSVQDWADDAVHVSEQHLSLGRDATLKHTVVTLGGDLVRVSPTARFTDTGGDVEMLGLYFADAGQHQEHRLFVDHAQAHCKSNVTYKGALQGEGAHSVWIGDVLIRAAAEGTETFELNRN